MKEETPTQVNSCSFCEVFKNTCGHRLLSVKGTTDCLYPRVPYDIEWSVIGQFSEKRPLLTKFCIMIVKINAFSVSMIFH